MRSLNIFLPWSLASYIPLNGFHPLYRSLASATPVDARLLVPVTLSREQYRQAIMAGVYKADGLPPTPAWAQGMQGFGFRDYATGHVSREILYAGRISADVELHHTAPVTLGLRPFVLQFESFLPVFFPHLQQGVAPMAGRTDEIRKFYRAMFESDHCLAVTSHITSSLDQFSDFFRSSKIDAKLVHLRNGIDASFRAEDVRRDPDRFDFLFINSAHQNPTSFGLRGGAMCLRLAIDLLRDGLPVRFYFRAHRPSDAELAALGVDPALARRYDNQGIIWLDNYLSDRALNRLMAKCHFLLLPSANLHSVSILSAMLNGTVPVVTDTYGTDAYVTDETDAVVLPGVRAAAWRHDPDRRIVADDHASYRALQPAIGRALQSRIRGLLAAPERIAALGAAARRRAETAFDGRAFADGLIELIRSRFAASPAMAAPLPFLSTDIYDVSWGEEWTEDLAPSHFGGPPQPVPLLDTDSGKIFRLRNFYIFVPDFRENDTALPNWSELYLATERFEAPPERRLVVSADFETTVEAARVETFRRIARPGASLPPPPPIPDPESFKEMVYRRLKGQPALLNLARNTYRSLRRLGVMK